MPTSLAQPTFLHLTDTHLSLEGIPLKINDIKVGLPKISHSSREHVLSLLLERLADHLVSAKQRLDGVIFSGDAKQGGHAGGDKVLLELLTRHLSRVGINESRLIAVPGNHDVPQGAEPSSAERYAEFIDAWRVAGCVTPWLDGIDPYPTNGATKFPHVLASDDGLWSIVAINSCNWSHTPLSLDEPLKSMWPRIAPLLASGDANIEKQLVSQLEKLVRFDVARVSGQQMEALRAVLKAEKFQAPGSIRIAAMHHHLRSPGIREEVKAFSDVLNLEHLRRFLRDANIRLFIHGHKHEAAVHTDHIVDDENKPPHRMLVISGATYSATQHDDAARLITLQGGPHIPTVKIEPIQVAFDGLNLVSAPTKSYRMWNAASMVDEGPVTLQGTDLDELYARAIEVSTNEAAGRVLVVHLDLPPVEDGKLPLPRNYPLSDELGDSARQRWLLELVSWWQSDRSRLEYRMPYIHGSRLRRFGGKIDQYQRIVNLLRKKDTSRAIAVLIDPFRDFQSELLDREQFASFCLVEFRRREANDGKIFVDCIAFYRAQEIARWWPINVAELRWLQQQIETELSFLPGRITTITAEARTISKSPTQVAMPLIDRWLDQAPERLHLLAVAFVERKVSDDRQKEVVEEWMLSLGAQREAASRFNSDGLPLAIEGPRLLASYIGAVTEDSDIELKGLVADLSDLANRNEDWEMSEDRSLDRFNRWAPGVKSLVDKIYRATTSLLQVEPKAGKDQTS